MKPAPLMLLAREGTIDQPVRSPALTRRRGLEMGSTPVRVRFSQTNGNRVGFDSRPPPLRFR